MDIGGALSGLGGQVGGYLGGGGQQQSGGGFNFGKLLGNFASSVPGVSLIGGLLGGLFGGGKPQMSHAQQNYMELMNGNINKEQNFANGVPMSDPQEQAALAQQRGMLGAEQMNARNDLFSQWNPTTNGNGTADMLARVHNQEVGQRGALDASALFNSLQQRRQALQNATSMINTASGMNARAPLQQGQGADLPGLFGNLFQTIAYSKARGQKSPGSDNPLAGLFGGAGGAAPSAAPGGMPQFPGFPWHPASLGGGGTNGAGGLQLPAGMNGVGAPRTGGALSTGHYGLGG